MTKLIKKGSGASGNSLELQPDWTIESDGFGLLTSKLTFKCDASSAAARAPKSGANHPEDGRLKCHRSSYTISKSGWAVITSDYVGIETGDRTTIQIKGDVVTGTQPIQVHKDFIKVLKPLGWDTKTQSFPETNATAVRNALVGVKSFLTADSSINATFYTANKSEVQDGANMVGKVFLNMAGMGDVVLPKGNQSMSDFHDRFAMLTGLNYEKYAHLYKVSFSIRISPGGYHKKIYAKHN
jgi:hypothetical protein